MSPRVPAEVRDFFISYTSADEVWAEWIAWELEDAGYTTVLQAWDFTPGSRFVTEMQRAMEVTSRTIAVLSEAYTESAPASAEWQEAWRQDPDGAQRRLLVFRIEDCARPGLLGQLVSVDLFDVAELSAKARLIAAVQSGRRKPPLPPAFPGREAPKHQPPFPGRLIPSDPKIAFAAGGPQNLDNPHAVAYAWWYSLLKSDIEFLDHITTPETHGSWELDSLRERIDDCSLATGVFKPVYDVAYVRLVEGLPVVDGTHQIVDGAMQFNAKMITLVLRPELGGWRVHGFGQPIPPGDLPRTWRNSP
ncbi:toll/interleukin-1 receptor domain-containing protein [Rhodococcus fascians]|jgi:hypothetical protein|nr:toll/interleukin-1 receptor domain-containing protein [Rhodococcus fascians]MBY3825500.1 toll/interleukin-1 receptor domain-containing protein [Rhodococcus fascians]MBY3835962.1 toll/interleukin-1 receptor domain-containing protein [Rhodococcus fascians]MBY3865174.1 toll/interleukin-1 receptor domain-containing protein [Rhodococcus fascians]MBY3884424.1 toll/interleukin-1 receptor domain-containing protein [Rhodococcus fascians]